MIKIPNETQLVVIRIQGGLGNQMFQFALGESIKKSLGIAIKYVVIPEPFLKRGKGTKRNLDIRKFRAIAELEIEMYPSLKNSLTLSDLLKKMNKKKKIQVFKESDVSSEHLIQNDTQILGLDGYWQSEFYFENAKKEILGKFSKPTRETSHFSELCKIISRGNNIGVHVRRGDYIENKKANSFHGACSLDYFRSALEFLMTKRKPKQIFIFSDDPEWARENFLGSDTVLVSNLKEFNPVEELLLLSMCSQLVLSNSSFSWWAAYLRENRNLEVPIVIAPAPWFKDEKMSSPRKSNWLTFDINSGSRLKSS